MCEEVRESEGEGVCEYVSVCVEGVGGMCVFARERVCVGRYESECDRVGESESGECV